MISDITYIHSSTRSWRGWSFDLGEKKNNYVVMTLLRTTDWERLRHSLTSISESLDMFHRHLYFRRSMIWLIANWWPSSWCDKSWCKRTTIDTPFRQDTSEPLWIYYRKLVCINKLATILVFRGEITIEI